MASYRAPVRDVRFLLAHVTPLHELTREPAFAHVDGELVAGVLEEAGRFAAEVVAPTNREGDRVGARRHEGRVVLPESLGRAYRAYVDAGWGALQHPVSLGGGGFPLTVANAVKEFVTSANLAFSLGPLLTTAAVHLLVHHGSPEQQRAYLPRMVTGRWTGTMDLTEPQAGSDVGAVATRAVPHQDGSYRLTGQKIFITYGDHELADNIVHLVLARLPDAPPGTRGLSLFIVPKRLLDERGEPGAANDLEVVSLEHKLGIHAAPTAALAFGSQRGGAVGELVGRPGEGMRQMFTMMNDARLGVALQGVAVAERAHQQALAHAVERRQGRAPAASGPGPSPIVDHPDVRRTLVSQKAHVAATRALCAANAHAIDLSTHAADPDVRTSQRKLADLLTPLSKAWCTDVGVEVASSAIQVHGGMGYVEETGVAQHLRDVRIAPIYEGTNGIQAVDLVRRKLGIDEGGFVTDVLAAWRGEVDRLPTSLASVRRGLGLGLDAAGRATAWLLARGSRERDVLAGATPYLRLLATVAGGVLLARGAAGAVSLLEAGADADFDGDFLAARIELARFFAVQVVEGAAGLEASVTAGADPLYSLTPAQLA